jgi:hypothetical protein
MTSKIYGEYIEIVPNGEYLKMRFSPSSIPLQQRWRNNGLSADFLSDYWATFFPAHDVESQQRQLEIKGAICYIANELLENVMKFSYAGVNCPVNLGLYLYQDEFRFYASNAIAPEKVEAFQATIQELLSEDPAELYMQRLEDNARAPKDGRSRLGLLTMLHDYGEQLAWKFEPAPHHPGVLVVTTMARLFV